MNCAILPSSCCLLALACASGGDPRSEVRRELELEPLEAPAGAGARLPNLDTGEDGRVYLSWSEKVAEEAALYVASLEGERWSEPREIVRGSDLFLNWADFPSVAALESGILIAHWLRDGTEPHAYHAEFALSYDRGQTWSEPQKIHSDRSQTEHGFVSLVPLDALTFGAVWLDGRRMSAGAGHGDVEGEMALAFRTIRADGSLGPESLLDTRVCDCCQTSLVLTRSEEAELIATYRDRSEGEVRDIARVVFDGEAWSKPELVREDGWFIAGCPVNGPRVAVLEGSTATAWYTGTGARGGDVYLSFRQEGASFFSWPIDVDDGLPLGRVDVVPAGPDSVLVSWLEHGGGDAGAGWHVRRVWRDGRKSPSTLVAPADSGRSSGFLRMAAIDAGVLFAWTTEEGLELAHWTD